MQTTDNINRCLRNWMAVHQPIPGLPKHHAISQSATKQWLFSRNKFHVLSSKETRFTSFEEPSLQAPATKGQLQFSTALDSRVIQLMNCTAWGKAHTFSLRSGAFTAPPPEASSLGPWKIVPTRPVNIKITARSRSSYLNPIFQARPPSYLPICFKAGKVCKTDVKSNST